MDALLFYAITKGSKKSYKFERIPKKIELNLYL